MVSAFARNNVISALKEEIKRYFSLIRRHINLNLQPHTIPMKVSGGKALTSKPFRRAIRPTSSGITISYLKLLPPLKSYFSFAAKRTKICTGSLYYISTNKVVLVFLVSTSE